MHQNATVSHRKNAAAQSGCKMLQQNAFECNRFVECSASECMQKTMKCTNAYVWNMYAHACIRMHMNAYGKKLLQEFESSSSDPPQAIEREEVGDDRLH